MLKENSELRAEARQALQGKWPMAAVAALIYSIIAGGLSAIPFIGGLCSLFVGLPVAYGIAIVMFGVYKGKDIDFGVLFEGFQDYSRIFVTKLLQGIYTSFVVIAVGCSGHHQVLFLCNDGLYSERRAGDEK